MKKFFKRTVSLALAVSLTAALGLPAAASDAGKSPGRKSTGRADKPPAGKKRRSGR